MKGNFKQYCFSSKNSAIIHDARILQSTKLMLNGARDDTRQCVVRERGLRETLHAKVIGSRK